MAAMLSYAMPGTSTVIATAVTTRLAAMRTTVDGRKGGLKRRMKIIAEAGRTEEVGGVGKAAIGIGLVANPIVAWSLFTLKTTGCGLPPGPGGSIGALEGISYLALISIVSWSLYTKTRTGSGLPPGPFGLLGAVEGLSYLSAAAIALVFALQFLDHGFIPAPIPSEQCFG